MAKITSKDLIESLKEMTILEVNDLIKAIEEEFGVSAAAPVAVAAAASADNEPAAATTVSVILKEVGQSKVTVIRTVKDITGMGLVEAKGLVDGAPAAIKENISVDEAEDIKKKLMEAGAVIEIK